MFASSKGLNMKTETKSIEAGGRKHKFMVVAIATLVFVLAFTLAACAVNKDKLGASTQKATTKPTAQKVDTPETDSYGVVEADSWSSTYPNQYNSYKENSSNNSDGKADYLELYPALKTMYKGYAFALGYDEAQGHTQSLDSVKNTPRTQKKEQPANCISCKTPQFTAT